MTERRSLRDFVTLQRGQSYKGDLVGRPGPFLLGLGTIERNGGFRSDLLRTYGGATPATISLTRGDLYVSLKDVTHAADLLGAVARVPDYVESARLTQDTIRLDVDDGAIDRDFLYWQLRGPEYRAYCRTRGTGTTNLDLSRDDFLGFEVVVPQRAEQRAIAEVLGALDDKIAANTHLIRSAESLSTSLFASMFDETESLPLTSVAQFINGKAFTKDASGTGRVVVRIAELNSGIGGSTVFSDATVPDQHVARPGDILFAWSGSLTLHRWFRPEAIINQHIFKVLPTEGRPHWLVWGLIARKLDAFKSIAADKATTMGHIQRRHLDEAVDVPVREVIARHDEQMSTLWSRTLSAERENLTLAATRDALLPALMSGKLRVRDAERAVEQAV